MSSTKPTPQPPPPPPPQPPVQVVTIDDSESYSPSPIVVSAPDKFENLQVREWALLLVVPTLCIRCNCASWCSRECPALSSARREANTAWPRRKSEGKGRSFGAQRVSRLGFRASGCNAGAHRAFFCGKRHTSVPKGLQGSHRLLRVS